MNEAYKDPRWQKRRLQIMERDGWACIACGRTDQTLHVHHKAYHGMPWDVSDHSLQTLCEKCHQALGPHPHAGIYFLICEGIAGIVIQHCPACAGQSLGKSADHIECRCGWKYPTGVYPLVWHGWNTSWPKE